VPGRADALMVAREECCVVQNRGCPFVTEPISHHQGQDSPRMLSGDISIPAPECRQQAVCTQLAE